MNNKHEYKVLLRVLCDVFIEIRASSDLQEAQIYADVFHNVPAEIASNFRPAAIEAGVMRRAQQLKCEAEIAIFFEDVKKRGNSSRTDR